jgi:hypothetical protein
LVNGVYAIAAPYRAEGFALDVAIVQVVPFHVQVSAFAVDPLPSPPNRATVEVASWLAIEANDRAVGDVAGVSLVHVVPFQV